MNIKNEIKEAFFENKKIFYLLIIIFIVGIIISWILADYIEPYFLPLLKQAMNGSNITSNEAVNILVHNETSAVESILLSVFFGIMAVVSIFTNAFAIGFLGGYMISSVNDLIMFIVLIVPHGIAEIPAMFCSSVSGILLFLFIFRFIKDIYHRNGLKKSYLNNKKTLKHMIVLMVISLILFAVAAFIEGYITPALGNWVNLQINNAPLPI